MGGLSKSATSRLSIYSTPPMLPLTVSFTVGSHADAAESQLSCPLSLLRESQEQPCNDLAWLEFQHFDKGPFTLFGKSSESWVVRFGSGAVFGARLQRSLHLLLFNFCSKGKSMLTSLLASKRLASVQVWFILEEHPSAVRNGSWAARSLTAVSAGYCTCGAETLWINKFVLSTLHICVLAPK